MTFVRLILVIAVFSHGSFALAKKRAPKAYSFITVAGKASQYECDGDGKVPRKLKHQKDIAKGGSYLGSEFLEIDPTSKANDEIWKHFFQNKSACNSVLAKTPTAKGAEQTEIKKDLPPEEPSDLDEDGDGNESKGEPETEP